MPRSMTGFGRAVRETESARIAVTLRSVNHRGLKVSTRVSDALLAMQPALEGALRRRLERGAVHLEAEVRLGERGSGYVLHRERLERYIEALAEVALRQGGEPRALRLELIAQLPGVIEEARGTEVSSDALLAEVLPVLEEAIDALIASRAEEGAALARDIRVNADAIAATCARVRERVPDAQRALAERTRARVERLAEALGGAIERDRDEGAILRELCLLAERADVSEELARLETHIVALNDALAKDEPVGRRLEFLAQELLREGNTMASKSADTGLLEHALDIKVAVDKIREQVANLE